MPFSVHWGVDALVAFLALFIVLWIFLGVPLAVVVGVSLLLGLAAAPLTRRLDRAGLAARYAAGDPAPTGPPPASPLPANRPPDDSPTGPSR